MAEGYNYHLTIPWHVARSYFRKLKERSLDQCIELNDIELYRMQGEARAYKKLDHLDEQLTMLEDGHAFPERKET